MTLSETFAAHKTLSLSFGAVLLLVSLIGVFMATKKVSPVSWGWFGPVNVESGLALKGYDPVSYRSGTPVLGTEEHTVVHHGATFRFANAENKKSFASDPAKFAPQYGGFCSFAMSKGFTANSSPLSYELIDEKLYIFDSDDMKANFNEAQAESLAASEKNWSRR